MHNLENVLDARVVNLSEEDISSLASLLQEGVYVDVHVGTSVLDVLTGDLGLDQEELEQIQTVFLNGKPVDDLAAAVVENNDTMALSAALPGLAGAVLRRGGFFARMRESISAGCQESDSVKRRGLIRLKAFNLLMRMIAPLVLQQGCYVQGDSAAKALGRDLPGGEWVRLTLSGRG